MRKASICSTLPMMVLAIGLSSTASAQATRTWVSGVGDDANPCSRTAPCKTFAGAISKTAVGGEIDCLDPGGFGAVTITKAITLDGGAGQVASILVSGTPGITINAGTGDNVTIRNLSIDGLGQSGSPGTIGINILQAKSVHLENVTIVNGFGTAGVQVNASASTSLTAQGLTITDVTGPGISVGTTGGTALADLREVRIWGCAPGLLGLATSVITVQNSIISMNGAAIKQTQAGSQINVINSQMNSNGNAMLSFPGSSIRSINNVMMQNSTAYNPNGGTISSDGQTAMGGNGSNGVANGTPITRM